MLKFCTLFLLNNAYKIFFRFFLNLFRSWVINKNGFSGCAETRFFSIFANKLRSQQNKINPEDTFVDISNRKRVQNHSKKIQLYPSWHSDVVTTLSQRCCWRCHNVVARSKMRVVPTSVSDVVTTSLSNVVKTLPQRCCNVATTLSIGLLGHFTTDYSDFFPFIETWESYQSAKWY